MFKVLILSLSVNINLFSGHRNQTSFNDIKPSIDKAKNRSYSKPRLDPNFLQSEEFVRSPKEQSPDFKIVSSNTKAQLLTKLKHKEKATQNWIQESSSGASLSYSKVFNASGKEYNKLGDPTQNIKIERQRRIDQENADRKCLSP